jgi:hypothetical protein
MGTVQGSDLFTARAGVKHQVECIRDWLMLAGLNRETAFTVTMKMQELADDALRQAAEKQAREATPRKVPAP